jgi:hypothetical protein
MQLFSQPDSIIVNTASNKAGSPGKRVTLIHPHHHVQKKKGTDNQLRHVRQREEFEKGKDSQGDITKTTGEATSTLKRTARKIDSEEEGREKKRKPRMSFLYLSSSLFLLLFDL